MVITKEEILENLKSIKRELKSNYKVETIGLFGSYVSNSQTATSDIDFLVEFNEKADLIDLIALSRFLEKLFNTKVDVISKPSLKEDIKQQVLKEVIYA